MRLGALKILHSTFYVKHVKAAADNGLLSLHSVNTNRTKPKMSSDTIWNIYKTKTNTKNSINCQKNLWSRFNLFGSFQFIYTEFFVKIFILLYIGSIITLSFQNIGIQMYTWFSCQCSQSEPEPDAQHELERSIHTFGILIRLPDGKWRHSNLRETLKKMTVVPGSSFNSLYIFSSCMRCNMGL